MHKSVTHSQHFENSCEVGIVSAFLNYLSVVPVVKTEDLIILVNNREDHVLMVGNKVSHMVMGNRESHHLESLPAIIRDA